MLFDFCFNCLTLKRTRAFNEDKAGNVLFSFQRSTFLAQHVRAWSGNILLETVRIPRYSCKPRIISLLDLTKSLERAIPSFAKRKKSVNWIIS